MQHATNTKTEACIMMQSSFPVFVLLIQSITISNASSSSNGIFPEESIGTTRSSRARIDSTLNEFNHIFPGDDDYDVNENNNGIGFSEEDDNDMSKSTFPRLLHTEGLYDASQMGKFISDDIIKYQQQKRRRQNQPTRADEHTIQLILPSSISSPTTTTTTTSSLSPSSNQKTFKTLKTGTTIVGVQTSTCIIIGADTRATEGSIVADKLCEKVHQLSKNIWCCGAGTSADLDALTRKVRYSFVLSSMIHDSIGNNNELNDDDDCEMQNGVDIPVDDVGCPLGEVSVSAMCHMIREELYKNNGDIGANLVMGGYDYYSDDGMNRPILLAIHPHGSIDIVPYTALGSGSLAAMGFLESRYRVGLSLEEGIELVKDAVRAGINNDLGSGSQIDLCIIDANGGGGDGRSGVVRYLRGVSIEETLTESEKDRILDDELFMKHTTGAILNNDDQDLDIVVDGVNGFGALPYRIKSRRSLLRDESQIKKENDEWLMNLIK